MVKKYLAVLLSTAFVITSLNVNAEPVSVKITKLSGQVDVKILEDQSWKPARAGMVLKTGDSIRAIDGKVILTFEDNSQVALEKGSVLQIMEASKDEATGTRTSLLQMVGGVIKSTVSKLTGNSKFAIQTAHVIAAVKGTEFIMSSDEKSTEVLVLRGVVSVSDILREHEFLIQENQRTIYREGRLENPGEFSPDELKRFDKSFEVQSARKFDRAALLNDAIEVREKSDIELKQDLAERIHDVQMGKVLTDVNGYRVRVDEYILRPQPNTIQLLNICKRTDGANAGITSLEMNDVFNKNLPDNFMDVRKNLNGDAWLDTTKAPEYYLLSSNYQITNPAGDFIRMESTMYEPQLVRFQDIPCWWQGYEEKFYINNSLKYTKVNDFSEPQRTATEIPVYNILARQPIKDKNGVVIGYDYTGDNCTYKNSNEPVREITSLDNGGMAFKETYCDGTWLTKEFYITNDSGEILNRKIDPSEVENLNWELIYKAPEFQTRTLDLIILPGIFKEL